LSSNLPPKNTIVRTDDWLTSKYFVEKERAKKSNMQFVPSQKTTEPKKDKPVRFKVRLYFYDKKIPSISVILNLKELQRMRYQNIVLTYNGKWENVWQLQVDKSMTPVNFVIEKKKPKKQKVQQDEKYRAGIIGKM
jgi:hypothetical protein